MWTTGSLQLNSAWQSSKTFSLTVQLKLIIFNLMEAITMCYELIK